MSRVGRRKGKCQTRISSEGYPNVLEWILVMAPSSSTEPPGACPERAEVIPLGQGEEEAEEETRAIEAATGTRSTNSRESSIPAAEQRLSR